jgi:hypothetical protein
VTIAAIVAHLGIGLGALGCQKCGRLFCPHGARRIIVTAGLMLAEASASVLVIDKIFHV